MSELDQSSMWEINRAGWNTVAPRFYGVAALPTYGPYAQTEDALDLLGDVHDKTVLEIGCGSGHSLLYLAQHGARELWGLDLSSKQLEFARALLNEYQVSATLFNAPMEQNPGLPVAHFDFALSIYSLGWTTDLEATLRLIYTYLKPGGFYVFSWENPFYSCLDYEAGAYIVKRPYHEQTVIEADWHGVPIVMHERQMSTYINSAVAAGFQIERLVEGQANPATSPGEDAPDGWYALARARLVPTTFILKLRKPLSV